MGKFLFNTYSVPGLATGDKYGFYRDKVEHPTERTGIYKQINIKRVAGEEGAGMAREAGSELSLQHKQEQAKFSVSSTKGLVLSKVCLWLPEG